MYKNKALNIRISAVSADLSFRTLFSALLLRRVFIYRIRIFPEIYNYPNNSAPVALCAGAEWLMVMRLNFL